MLLYSGVKPECRAAEELTNNIMNWNCISEKLRKIEMDFKDDTSTTLVIIYGSNEDEPSRIKEAFWNELTWITENLKGRIIQLGDFNSRVRKGPDTIQVVGRHGEDIRNNNGPTPSSCTNHCINIQEK